MSITVEERALRRFSLAEYAAMVRHGILTADDRVELIAGEIVEMPPIGNPHKGGVTYLTQSFFGNLPRNAATVMVQQGLAIFPDSMPQPDLALLRFRADAYRSRHNEPGDVLLLVEVADASLRYDRGTKRRLYAKAGVPEYWIVDLTGTVEVYREPRDEAYASVRVAKGDDVVAPAAFPDCRLSVEEILGVRA